MNERINELVNKATECYSNGQERTFDKEKFAELIVKEMLVTCEQHPAWTGRMIGEKIKLHFGVE
jgi:metal-sulfur cluster biosynthetic enzyme